MLGPFILYSIERIIRFVRSLQRVVITKVCSLSLMISSLLHILIVFLFHSFFFWVGGGGVGGITSEEEFFL